MSKPYSVLNVMRPEAFLDPTNFVTFFDRVGSDYSLAQYEKGLRCSRDAESVHVSANGTWGARMKNGASVSSYEGIGYHAATADLLRGLLDGGATFYVYRNANFGVTKTKIK